MYIYRPKKGKGQAKGDVQMASLLKEGTMHAV
jgi:hypothetical protein